jgi:hypothetical protein
MRGFESRHGGATGARGSKGARVAFGGFSKSTARYSARQGGKTLRPRFCGAFGAQGALDVAESSISRPPPM